MSPERIAKLHEMATHFTWQTAIECLDEIERLTEACRQEAVSNSVLRQLLNSASNREVELKEQIEEYEQQHALPTQ